MKIKSAVFSEITYVYTYIKASIFIIFMAMRRYIRIIFEALLMSVKEGVKLTYVCIFRGIKKKLWHMHEMIQHAAFRRKHNRFTHRKPCKDIKTYIKCSGK